MINRRENEIDYDAEFADKQDRKANEYTAKEAAEYLKVSSATISRWVKEGVITPLNAGYGFRPKYIFRKSSLDKIKKRRKNK